MKFAVAAKGTDVPKEIGCCESILIFEEMIGKIVLRQILENAGRKPAEMPVLLGEYGIEAFLCGELDERSRRAFQDKGIGVVTGVSGNADKAAEGFALAGKKQAKMKSCLQPAPRVLVSCRGVDGENNVLAVAYCCNCSFSPPMVMVGIVPTRYSYKMIKESGCFVVNLVDRQYRKTFDYLGSHSKKDGDKLSFMNVRLQDGKKVNAPILPDCPVNIECTVLNSIVTGSHEMFVGKVEYVHAEARLLDAEGNIDFSQIDFI